MQGSTEASTSKLPIPVPSSPSTSSKVTFKSRRKSQEQSWSEIVRSGVAGGIAGCVAKTSVGHESDTYRRSWLPNSTAPLDRVKILFQTGSQPYEKYSGTWTGVFKAGAEIYREAGIRGLLQGHSATLLRIFPYAGIKFMAYESLHRVLMPTPDSVTSPRLFAAGAISGVTTVFLTYPLDLIRVRLAYDRRLPAAQLQGHSALVFSILKIYHEGDPPLKQTASPTPLPQPSLAKSSPIQPYFKNPSKAVVFTSSLFQRFPILKFYRGFVVSIIGMVPYAGTSFLVWGYLKKRYADPETQKTSTTMNLAFGAIAGVAAQTSSYPFEVVRRRMQVGGILRPDRFFGFFETVQFVYRRNGWRGFFVGLSIGYLKVVPLTAISFATWQSLKGVMGVRH